MIKIPIMLLTAAVIGTTGSGAILGMQAQTSHLPQNGNTSISVTAREKLSDESMEALMEKLGMTISGGKGCFIRIWPGFIGGGILQGLPGLLPDTECPDTELPDVEVPDTELPDIELPDVELPDVELPDVELPDTELPDVELPDVELPDVELPDTELPDVELPDIELPDAELPGTGNPGADVPDAEAPDSSEDSVQDTSFAAQVVKLVNEERKKAGLSELTVDLKVQSAANVRAKEIVSSFSHTRPDGRQFSTALTEAGVSFRGSGENIAWGQRTPEAVMQAWMNSSGHRANILNARYTSIGVGYYVVNGTPYWTELFTY